MIKNSLNYIKRYKRYFEKSTFFKLILEVNILIGRRYIKEFILQNSALGFLEIIRILKNTLYTKILFCVGISLNVVFMWSICFIFEFCDEVYNNYLVY